jgi:hypothetical protein
MRPSASVRMTPSPIAARVTWARSFSWNSASSESLRSVTSRPTAMNSDSRLPRRTALAFHDTQRQRPDTSSRWSKCAVPWRSSWRAAVRAAGRSSSGVTSMKRRPRSRDRSLWKKALTDGLKNASRPPRSSRTTRSVCWSTSCRYCSSLRRRAVSTFLRAVMSRATPISRVTLPSASRTAWARSAIHRMPPPGGLTRSSRSRSFSPLSVSRSAAWRAGRSSGCTSSTNAVPSSGAAAEASPKKPANQSGTTMASVRRSHSQTTLCEARWARTRRSSRSRNALAARRRSVTSYAVPSANGPSSPSITSAVIAIQRTSPERVTMGSSCSTSRPCPRRRSLTRSRTRST